MKNYPAIALIVFTVSFANADTFGSGSNKTDVWDLYDQSMLAVAWDHGVIYLNDGNTIKGKLHYNLEKDLVLLENQGRVMVFTAEKISRFTFYDHLLSAQRNFISVNPENLSSKKRIIFEIVMPGRLTLLRLQKSGSGNDGYYDDEIQQFMGYSSGFTYFFLYKNKVHRLRNFKKQYISIAGESMNEIKEYILQNKLKYTSIPHQVKLIKFFNNL
jgi:hypothetical protein